MRPNTYNPDCDFDPDQRDLDASIEERNKTEPNATARARAWVQKQTGRFELDNPLLEADIADLAAFLESEAPRIRAEAEAENALLKKKLEIAMRGLDEYGDEGNWECSYFGISHEHDSDCGQDLWYEKDGYELARRIKAEIEEVK